MNYKKIALIGVSASGKSTASRKIESKTRLPLFHMDHYFWKKNGEDIPEEEYLVKHKELLKKEEWIIEGYIDAKMSDRLRLADVVLYLDYSSIQYAWQLIQRWSKRRNISRTELAPEALEKFSFSFLWLVLTRGERIRIEESIKFAKPQNLKRFCSPSELEAFMQNEF